MSRSTAVVTGTSSGIGHALASELLGRGWRVIGMARRPSPLDDARYTHIQVDLADVAHLSDEVLPALEARVAEEPPSRMALVNNAAAPGLLGPVARLDPAEMLRVYAVNVVAPIALMGWFVRRGGGRVPLRIVNVSSGADTAPYPGLGAYGSAKAALRMAGMVLAAELAMPPHGDRDITILSYGPGRVDTAMQAEARAAPVETFPLRDTFAQWAAEGHLLGPEIPAAEIATYLERDGYPAFHECRSGEFGEPASA